MKRPPAQGSLLHLGSLQQGALLPPLPAPLVKLVSSVQSVLYTRLRKTKLPHSTINTLKQHTFLTPTSSSHTLPETSQLSKRNLIGIPNCHLIIQFFFLKMRKQSPCLKSRVSIGIGNENYSSALRIGLHATTGNTVPWDLAKLP